MKNWVAEGIASDVNDFNMDCTTVLHDWAHASAFLSLACTAFTTAADVAAIIHPYHYRTIYQANFDLRVPVKKKLVDGVI